MFPIAVLQMRFFNRQNMAVPERLTSRDAYERRAAVMDYVASVYSKGGQRRAPDHKSFLRDTALVRDVRDSFLGNCAYCERRCIEDGIVHHHRPPGLAADREGHTELLNYVWLTYEWENLYWVCPSCASRKGNRFFTRTPTRETGAEIGSLRRTEGELLLDPCHHVPHVHLLFQPNGAVEGLTSEGQETVRLLGLDQAELRALRRDTGHRLVNILRKADKAAAWATELDQGPLNATPTSRRTSAKGKATPRNLPCLGGASLALINWAGDHGISRSDARGMLEAISNMRAYELDAMLDQYSALIEKFEASTRGVRVEAVSTQTVPSTSDAPTTPKMPPAPNEARIRNISIRNFKALKSIDLTLPISAGSEAGVSCAVILGENATGKSSVLEGVALALLGTAESILLDVDLGGNEVTPGVLQHRPDPDSWDVVSPDPLRVDIFYAERDQGTHLIANSGSKAFEGDIWPAKVVLGYGPRRYFSKRRTRRFRAARHRVRSLFDPLMTIQNPGDWLLTCDQKPFDAAVRALREVLMLDDDDTVLRDADNHRVLIDTAQGRTPLSSLSEGYKSVVAMSVDITRELLSHYDNIENAHAVVLIDEIETHLHPRWKMQIMDRLRRAFPCVQFFVTTHDPLCLRGMRSGEVFVLQRDPVNRRVESLANLPEVQGLRAEQILTSEFFGLGSTDPETDAKLRRYEALTLRLSRTPGEAAEMDRLRDEIADRIKVGDTIKEQLLNEAFARADIDPFAAMPKVRRQDRGALVARLRSAVAGKGQALSVLPNRTGVEDTQ